MGVAVGFVCRLVCLALSAVMLADVWHLELNDYRMIVKGWGAFSDGGLSPQPCRLSHISSWGRGEVGERRERGLAESTCRTCPEAHLSTSQRQLLSLSLSVSVTFWLYFSITSSASVSFLTHLSLCLSPSLSLHFASVSTLQNK